MEPSTLNRRREQSGLNRQIEPGRLNRLMLLRNSRVALATLLTLALASAGQSQTPAQTQKPGPTPKPPATMQTPPVGPAASQSRHFPVLLLVVGMNPAWNLRIGPTGPERLDRPGYPPVFLEPAEVTQESPTAWAYHAKDLGTGAVVLILLSREACSDGTATKYSFRAVAQHAQLGTLNGCARIAAELFPRANQQEDDTDDAAKKKATPETTITGFKMPVDVAYVSATKKVMLRHGTVPKVAAQEGAQPALSHDGKKLLYTRGEGSARAIVLYDAAAGKSTDVATGDVAQAFWSPDDTRFAYAKLADGHWRLWIAPLTAPASPASPYSGEVTVLHGWADAHTLLVDDLNQLSWVSDDGRVQRALSDKDVCGDVFAAGSSGNVVRINPLNPDLLVVSAELTKAVPIPQLPVAGAVSAGGTPTPATTASAAPAAMRKPGAAFFLYEITSKRRIILSPPELQVGHPEWSRDGLQVFFTATDASKRTATWRIFWDGSGSKRYLDGRELVIGQ